MYIWIKFLEEKRVIDQNNRSECIHLGEKHVIIECSASYTIKNLKKAFEIKIGSPMIADQSILAFNRQKIEDEEKRLLDLKIQEGSIVNLFLKFYQIFVRTVTDKTISLDVEPTDTINQLRKKIETKLGYSIQDQLIVYRGYSLGDENNLIYYNIYKSSTLHLTIRLRGGIGRIQKKCLKRKLNVFDSDDHCSKKCGC